MKLASAKLVLSEEVDARLAEFVGKRRRDKRKAFALRLSAVGFGALITLLVGVRTEGTKLEAPIKDVVLVLGFLTVIVNAWDAFYDHRALWVKRTSTVARLKQLKRDLDFEMAVGEGVDHGLAELRAIKVRLDQTLADDHRNWIQLRDDAGEQKDAKGKDAKAGEPAG